MEAAVPPIPSVPGADVLSELALELRWTWDHGLDEIWKALDSELWDLTHNPWVVLQSVSPVRLKGLLADSTFRTRVERLLMDQRQANLAPAWFQHAHSKSPLTRVAYFSMEFGLSEALPIYSGGLGNVAGDQLKAACDLGVPVVGVGLLYQQGYFRQNIEADGHQTELYPYNAPGQMPVARVRDKDGEWLRLEIALPGQKIWLRTWEARVGRIRLYLLDSNDPANPPAFRGITSELYGGGPELRLRQEIVLGIGGWRMLHELGIRPEVCHLNEGHAAFAVLERARTFMQENQCDFATAMTATRGGNLFTTHTPVAAGFDRFAPNLMDWFVRLTAERCQTTPQTLMALGRLNPDDSNEPFNMAYLAIRGSAAVNGVSRLHEQVSRVIFQDLYPRWPQSEVPVGHVTNGVHTPSWDSAEADRIWTFACASGLWRGTMEGVEERIRAVKDETLWEMRNRNRRELVTFIRGRLVHDLLVAGAGEEELRRATSLFDPNALTLGFARRFATYKRPTLLLHDPERLVRLLTNPDRRVQLIIAGKAHPADVVGKAMVQQWVTFTRRPEVQGHVVFVSDYDLRVAERLVQGVDVWINNPRRPWEASGTSGMKILVNGGLNLSELDGWWVEAYSPEVGWAFGDGKEHGDDQPWDATEADSLYALLESEVIPRFYDRDQTGKPRRWIEMMRQSMSRLTPRFSASRSVREYTEKYYLPLASSYLKRTRDKGALAKRILDWENMLDTDWPKIHFGNATVESVNGCEEFRAELHLNGLDPRTVRVEMCAQADGDAVERVAMERLQPLSAPADGYLYGAKVPSSRPASDYTARAIPVHPDVAIPHEARFILWQK